MIKICPSTNPVDENFLIDFVKEIEQYGIEFLHCDVMDGKFVENKCLDVEVLKPIKEQSLIGLDIHLMCNNPIESVIKYSALFPNYITTHIESYESYDKFFEVVKYLKSKGILIGISIKPSTKLNQIIKFMPMLDLVLIMSVEPGKSGQKFMPEVLPKIKELRNYIDKNMFKVKIEVDGGINDETALEVIEAGADMLVIGNAFYSCLDRKSLIKKIEALESYYKKQN